jgi:hypothetical protein
MNERQFAAEVTSSLVLLDPMGRLSPVLTADTAGHALDLANEAFSLGGLGKVTNLMDEDEDDDNAETILLYYRSQADKATKSEIANAAKVIARSNVRYVPADDDGVSLYVTGSRGVVYPARQRSSRDPVVFLVSRAVWFNANRVTIGFPSGKKHVDLFLADINDRLPFGSVTVAR